MLGRAHSLRRVRAHAWLAMLVAAAVLAAPVASARADGDPASDVLVDSPPLFLSLDSGATVGQETAIVRQLDRAARHGVRLRVAVIAHRVDLGSVTALWGRPQEYADFLGRELSLAYHGELLVVMPSGFGVSRGAAPVRTALARLAPRGNELVAATEQAIDRLTGVAAPAVRVTAVPAASPVSGLRWWLPTGIAVGLVGLAWAASLRARPLALGRASRSRSGDGSAA